MTRRSLHRHRLMLGWWRSSFGAALRRPCPRGGSTSSGRDPRTTPALICRSLHRPPGWYTHMLTRTLQDFLIYACAGTVIFRKICGGQVRDTALVEGLDKHRKESLRHEPLLLDSTQTVHARIVHPSPRLANKRWRPSSGLALTVLVRRLRPSPRLRNNSGHDLILAPLAPAARSHQAAKAKTHDLAHEATLHLDHPGCGGLHNNKKRRPKISNPYSIMLFFLAKLLSVQIQKTI